jgi:hypothetical protein
VKSSDLQREIKSDNFGRGKPSKTRPWLWMEKSIVRRIRDVFDATNDVSSALAIGVALAEIASDEGRDTFTRPIGEIGKRAGICYRTTASILDRFEQLEIIHVQRNAISGTKLKAPSTYTLCTLGNQCLSIGIGRIQGSLPRDMIKKEKRRKNDSDKPERARVETLLSNSTPAASTNGNQESGFCSERHQHHQNQPAQNHVKWPEFAAYCRSKLGRDGRPGRPTEKGFWTWLSKQKSQWRNKVRTNGEVTGYVLDGKFFTTEVANQMGRDDPNLIAKFRRAVKRNGKIKITR